MIVDYHVHLRGSGERVEHTVDAAERFVETATRRGVDELGFSEHVYYFRQTAEIWDLPYQVERCVCDLDAYCEAVLEARRRGLPVKLGLEVDYVGEHQGQLSELLSPYPFDYLLGSVHWLDGLAVDQEPGVWAHLSVEAVWERYVDGLCELGTSGAVDILAHPDLPKIFGRRPEPAVLAALHERVAEAIAGSGVALEISTAGLRKPIGELYPDYGLLRAGVLRGVPVTLASDAHSSDLVGHAFDDAVELARDAGCETVTVFDGRQARQEQLG